MQLEEIREAIEWFKDSIDCEEKDPSKIMYKGHEHEKKALEALQLVEKVMNRPSDKSIVSLLDTAEEHIKNINPEHNGNEPMKKAMRLGVKAMVQQTIKEVKNAKN